MQPEYQHEGRLCGHMLVSPTGLTWVCIREPHDSALDDERVRTFGGQRLAPDRDRHRYVRLRRLE